MERPDTNGSDHVIYCVAGIAVLIALASIALHSVLVVHRVELPTLRWQAQFYAFCLMGGEHEVELQKIDYIARVLDSEISGTGNYSRIKAGVLKKAVKASTAKTRKWTRILTCVFLSVLGLCVTWRSIVARRRLLEGARRTQHTRKRGIEEFIRLTGKYLTPEMIRQVRDEPSPENLALAFSLARAKVNIPCCRVARLFPEKTRERFALLAYGKTQVVFAEDDKLVRNS
ncbi:MAG: hypothetical protein ACYDHW_07690 [Syntrophorhabdaceae bacterium]